MNTRVLSITTITSNVIVRSYKCWLVTCELCFTLYRSWLAPDTNSTDTQGLDAVTKREGAHVELLSDARALFHYILGGQNIMQNYSAIFLSWFVPVRADNEEILISCQASLSFVTEQIVWWP